MSSYDWIDENVAIGNNRSMYSEFDIVINLDYPNNNVDHHCIDVNYIFGRNIYNIGIYDSPDERMYELLVNVIPELVKYYNINNKVKILFHCFAGISRSSTMAIAFLCKSKGYKLNDAYNLVVSKRDIVKPNDGFLKQLQYYLIN